MAVCAIEWVGLWNIPPIADLLTHIAKWLLRRLLVRIGSLNNRFMSHSFGKEFRKTEVCPRSEELLEFANGEGPLFARESVSSHLPTCDFCSTEVDIYRRFPQDEAPAPTPRIPRALLEYATALLVGSGGNENRRRATGADGEIDFDQACGAF